MKRYKLLRKIDDFRYIEVVEFTDLEAFIEAFSQWYKDVLGNNYLVIEVVDV